MSAFNEITKTVIPLPTTTEDLLARRQLMNQRTLNDHVDDIHVSLWSDQEYRKLLEAVWDEDATEGALAIDNYLAAIKIRTWAREHGNPHVQDKKAATIVKALNIVLRRYNISRAERKNMIGDTVVRNGNGGE